MPVHLLEACEAIASLRDACPGKLPSSTEKNFRFQVFRQGRHWTFTAETGAGPYREPRKNRPPGFVHVVLQAGDLSDAFETFTYSNSTTFPLEDGLMRGTRSASVSASSDGSARRRRASSSGRGPWAGGGVNCYWLLHSRSPTRSTPIM
jgi:hypothetical protein